MRLFAAALLAASMSPPLALAAPVASTLSITPAPQEAPSQHGSVRIGMRREILPPGGRLPDHRQDGDRYLFVVSGRLKLSDLTTGGEQVVEAGKMAAEQPGDWHAAQAVGDAPVVLYVIDRAPAGAAGATASN
jgi:quercetin dioxygenase-like cupin family protein